MTEPQMIFTIGAPGFISLSRLGSVTENEKLNRITPTADGHASPITGTRAGTSPRWQNCQGASSTVKRNRAARGARERPRQRDEEEQEAQEAQEEQEEQENKKRKRGDADGGARREERRAPADDLARRARTQTHGRTLRRSGGGGRAHTRNNLGHARRRRARAAVGAAAAARPHTPRATTPNQAARQRLPSSAPPNPRARARASRESRAAQQRTKPPSF